MKNFIAVGLNYEDHAKETGAPIPKEPILFNKLPNCIVGPNDDVMIPKGSLKLDYEVEIAFVLGKRARYVAEKDALSHIAGYCICNDVSERHFQAERGGQWMKGKCAETFGPLGPWLVTRDEIADVQNLAMSLDVNGQRRQTGTTRTMIFGIAHQLSLHLPVHGAGARRRGDHRNPARRRPRHEAAGVAQGRRHHDAQNRGPGRAEVEGGAVQGVALHTRHPGRSDASGTRAGIRAGTS